MSLLSRDFDEIAPAQQESIIAMLWRLTLLSLQLALLILVSSFPIGIPHFASVRPALLPIAVYDWAIFAPLRLPPLAAFLAGFVMDLLSAGPLGLNALTMLLVQRLTLRQRKFLSGQPFVVIWLGFFLVSSTVFLIQWATFSMFEWELLDARPALFGALLTSLFHPPVVWFLNAFNRTISRGFGSMR
jgi:rod shape-determining protein MreD